MFFSYHPDKLDTGTILQDKKKINLTEDLLELELKPHTEGNNYGFEDYQICEVKGRLSEYEITGLQKWIIKIVEKEAPVHFDIICQRVCILYNRQKATTVVQRRVKRALSYMHDSR